MPRSTSRVRSSRTTPPCTRTTSAPGPHGAVWRLNITVAGTPLTVPIYVDAITAGPEATFSSAKIQLCLAGPIGTPAGAQLLAFFDVNGVFTNPSNTSNRVWKALFTPYNARFADPESRRDDRGPGTRAGPRRADDEGQEPEEGSVTITGRLLVNGQAVPGRE